MIKMFCDKKNKSCGTTLGPRDTLETTFVVQVLAIGFGTHPHPLMGKSWESGEHMVDILRHIGADQRTAGFEGVSLEQFNL